MAGRAPTREMCKNRLDGMPGVGLDLVCVELGKPGNASELSRYLRGLRDTAPGKVGPQEVWDAINRLDPKKRGVAA